MIHVEQAKAEHAELIAQRIRPADAAELLASGFATPLEGILSSIRVSLKAWTVFDAAEAGCVIGYWAPIVGQTACPWMITTDVVERHRIAFARNSRKVIAEMQKEYPRLVNYVDARHQVCIRWLRWLGFTIHEAEAFGPLGMPFHRFER